MAAIAGMKQEWRQFRHDEPGRRFENHRRRMKQKPTWLAALRIVLGVGLFAAGVAFLFLPGPGLVGVVFGLALLAGMSGKLSSMMDRAEPRLRELAGRGRVKWQHMTAGQKALLVAAAGVVATLAAFAAWELLVR